MTCPSCAAANEPGRKFCGECGARLAQPCPNCGTVNASGVRFCGECGNLIGPAPGPLGTPTLAPVAVVGQATPGLGPLPAAFVARPAPIAERRLVSVLFADLVGFTTLSEGRDPETVRELLARYFEQAADVIGRYGGTVEKFIGDAVMAVWGAPTAHEDDAERAVRAALDLVDMVRELGPGVLARAGVLTGEAAVTIGATGQGMVAGDLVNTASRLQSVAAPGTVLVGEATFRVTSEAVAYEPAGEHLVKGKALPVAAWRATRVVAQRKGLGRDDRLEAPFVGRDAELRLLKDLFHASSREHRVRLVSITGQAGIGKSRLAWEFLKYVDGVVENVWWHEGRSPAYGEGITFWALGEMVRSRARLLETDDPATTRTRIAEMVAAYVPDEGEQRRIEPALLALLGVGEAPAGGQPALFAAWRLFFERLAASGIVAMLFEDLQWADTGTLDFIEHLLEWSRNVPIMIVTLARPDLLDRRPDWGAGRRAFLALDLQTLDEASMRALLAGLVPGLPGAAASSIIARADGIPLYAVETVRMLVADGRLLELPEGGYRPAGELGELAVPDSLHALIAARLDALEPVNRALVQDAAVLGQSFTADALAAIAGLEAAQVPAGLERLVRGDLVRVEVDPRSPERGQYAFVQALIREVAYSTLSLRDRRSRHLAAARYFEAIGEEELAGAVAAHFQAAYRSSSDGPEAAELAGLARAALLAAGSRADRLGSQGQALSFYTQALEVTTDPRGRAELLELAGIAANRAARYEPALRDLELAIAAFEALGDRSAAARVAGWYGQTTADSRRRPEAADYLEAAFARYADLSDRDPNLVWLMRCLSAATFLTRAYPRALEIADRQLAAAELLGDVRLATEALRIKGAAAFYLGRLWEARALLQGAYHLAQEADLPEVQVRVLGILTSAIALDSPAESLALEHEAIDLARRLGQRGQEIVITMNATEDARRTGEWDWAVAALEQLSQLDVDAEALLGNRNQQALYDAYRGMLTDADRDTVVADLQATADSDLQSGASDVVATSHFVAGRWAEAAASWLTVVDISDLNVPYALPKAGRAALLARDGAVARAALDSLAALGTRGRTVDADRAVIRAGLAALDGDRAAALAGYRMALASFRELGLAWDEALLGLEAVTLLGAADPEAADAEVAGWVDASRAIFTRLRAAPMLDRLNEAATR
jgi:class 3 adenylate cyclase/tetratricopeptide (TPR) repeat protein